MTPDYVRYAQMIDIICLVLSASALACGILAIVLSLSLRGRIASHLTLIHTDIQGIKTAQERAESHTEQLILLLGRFQHAQPQSSPVVHSQPPPPGG